MSINQKIQTYIPDRQTEGYGPNNLGFNNLISNGAKIIFTVDCGTLSFGPINFAQKLNVDVIVLDHHQSDVKLPEACAIVNPNRYDDTSELNYLCAAGVCFVFLVALNKKLRDENWFKNNNINIKEYSVWTDSQGHGYTAQLFKSLAEVEENHNNSRTAVAKYRSEHDELQNLWIKMSASGKSSVWKIIDGLSTQPLKEDTTKKYEFRINRLIQVKKSGIEDFITAQKEGIAIDKEVGVNYDQRIYENVFGHDSPSYLITTGSSDVYSYYSEWEKRKDKRQSSPKFADFFDKFNQPIRKTEIRHLTFQKELHYKP